MKKNPRYMQVQTVEVEDYIIDRLELVKRVLKKRKEGKSFSPNTDMLKAVLAYKLKVV